MSKSLLSKVQIFVITMLMVYSGSMAQVEVLPLSFSNNLQQDIRKIDLPRPNYEQAALEDAQATDLSYRIGLVVPSHIDLLKEGSYYTLSNGQVVIRAAFSIPEAKGIDAYFSHLFLEEGVTLFVYNENMKQIVSYNHLHNSETGIYATEIIQGEKIFLEINANNQTLLEKTKVVLEKFAANYRGGLVNSIAQQYGEYDNVPLAAHPCHINANCPQGDGFRDVQKTAVHLNYVTGASSYVCSGNMINNTAGDCKPYLLTASHCEGSLGMNDATFANWKFVFDYQVNSCSGLLESPKKTITGAKFRARSLHTEPTGAASLVLNGDFLLLEIIDNANLLGTTIKPYLGGWDRKNTTSLGEKLISFHHPAGDPKKLTIFKFMQGNGSFNGGGTNTHWACAFEQGGSEGGSSGSNIFSMTTKRIRGTLSGGVRYTNSCDTAPERRAQYSKFDRNWLYTAGNNTSAQRLKDWLDPGNLDLQSVNTVLFQPSGTGCGILSVQNVQDFNDQVNIYPNPISNKEQLQLSINNDKIRSCIIDIIDLKGTTVATYNFNNLANAKVSLELPALANGMYIVRIANEKGYTNKKLVISN